MTGDISLSQPRAITNDVTIDLAGHSITSNASAPMLTVNGAKLTLKGDGSIESRGQAVLVRNGGEVTVENGTYESSAAEVIRVNDGKVTINGGLLTGREGAVTGREGGSTIIVNDGILVGTDNFAIATHGSNGMGSNTIIINGGTMEGNIVSNGYEAIGVYVANSDTFVMNDGEIIAHGGTGLCMRAGDVTINGGTITATNVDKNGNIVADGKVGDNNTVMTGCSAVIFHETSNYPGQKDKPMKLTIKGGTITGVDHSVQVLSESEHPNVFVTGGTFNPPYPEAAGG